MDKRHRIKITVEGGVIQAIDDIPEGIEVLVMDFDCDESPYPTNNVKENKDGDYYWETIWA